MQKRRNKSLRLNVAKTMPPLRHSIPGDNFDIRNSEVVQWLVSQPEILQYLFDKVAHGYLEYDSASKKWKGVDFNGSGN